MLGRLLLAAMVAGAALVGIACESDAQRVRELNQTATATPTPPSAEIGSGEIEDGDCITSTLPEGITFASVVITPCSSAWGYRVLSSFEAAGQDGYPGEDFLSQAASLQCDRRYTYFLYPTRESWEAPLVNDRKVNCLQHSFGLAETDPAKLDRLVNAARLDAGECYNEAPETDGLLVELVDCSGEWEYRVLNTFTVADAAGYPDDDSFGMSANERCDRRFTEFEYPTSRSWSLGDRTVICIQGSFGLSAVHPAKLERLANESHLDVGECYREAPETDGLLVELVDCSGEWEYQVVDFILVPGGAYPGDDYFREQAQSRCAMPWEYYYAPSSRTWAEGSRKVICIGTP